MSISGPGIVTDSATSSAYASRREALSPAGTYHTQSGYPGTNASGKTIRRAPLAAASRITAHAFRVVAAASRNSGLTCAAATRNGRVRRSVNGAWPRAPRPAGQAAPARTSSSAPPCAPWTGPPGPRSHVVREGPRGMKNTRNVEAAHVPCSDTVGVDSVTSSSSLRSHWRRFRSSVHAANTRSTSAPMVRDADAANPLGSCTAADPNSPASLALCPDLKSVIHPSGASVALAPHSGADPHPRGRPADMVIHSMRLMGGRTPSSKSRHPRGGSADRIRPVVPRCAPSGATLGYGQRFRTLGTTRSTSSSEPGIRRVHSCCSMSRVTSGECPAWREHRPS